MTPLTANLISFLSLGNIVLNVVAVALIAALFLPKKDWAKKIISFVNRYALETSFILVTVATFGSLYLSEIALFNPCKYCWFQRIFMYPLVVLTLMALIKKDLRRIYDYILGLSIIGTLIAAYHYFLQFGPLPPKPCSVVGYYSESCSEKLFVQFGYVTIPMMALSVFLVVTLSMYIVRRTVRQQI